jgi:hypothetical protein
LVFEEIHEFLSGRFRQQKQQRERVTGNLARANNIAANGFGNELDGFGSRFASVERGFEPRRNHIEVRARREEFSDPTFLEFGNVIIWDDSATEEHNIVDALLPELGLDQWEQRHVGAGKDRKADGISILLDGRGHDLIRSLEQTGINHLKTGISEGSSDDLGPSVMAIEAWFCDDDAVPSVH